MPKNETSPIFRHLALNSEGIRYLNEATHVITHELSSQDELKLLIISHLIECDTIHDDIQSSSSSSFSSSSSSSSFTTSDDNLYKNLFKIYA